MYKVGIFLLCRLTNKLDIIINGFEFNWLTTVCKLFTLQGKKEIRIMSVLSLGYAILTIRITEPFGLPKPS